MWKLIKRILRTFFVVLVFVLGMTNSGVPSLQFSEQVRIYTRQIEFDYVNWTLQAVFQKLAQGALGGTRYIESDQQKEIMERYLFLVDEDRALNAAIGSVYADPEITEDAAPTAASDYILHQQAVRREMRHITLFSEALLQQQLGAILSENGLTAIGQAVPPVQYHTTALPYALIVSPRDLIRQDADISLLPDLTLDQMVRVEKQVEESLNVSALVVPVGGIGVYPTMVMETSNLPWLAEVVAHEWTHNFLTLRPLGLLYDQSPALRTINETTASIAGKELGELVLRGYYPALLPEPTKPSDENKAEPPPPPPPQEPSAFDYQAAMRETRVSADELLAEGKVEEAEAYMESRRLIFLENGYNIRRLNQAYFAFYGAYADSPGGAAGEDPVGAAVRSLRAHSEDLESFLRKIAWVRSYEDLLKLLPITGG